MKKQYPLLILALILAACQALPVGNQPNQETIQEQQSDTAEPFDFTATLDASDWEDLRKFEVNLIPSAAPILDEMKSAPYYKLSFELDKELKNVRGLVEVRYVNQSSDVLDSIVFQLFPFVYGGTVDLGDILVNQEPAKLSMEENVPVVNVMMDGGLAPGDSCVITIPFTSSIPREMGGNYGLYGYFDETVVLDGFYPLLALYDEGEWHLNITSHNGDIKYEEMSFYDVTAKIPADMNAVTTGQAISEQNDGDMKTIHYLAGPVREYYFAGSEKFVSIEEQVGDTVLISTSVEGTEDAIQHALEIGKASMEVYSEHFVTYPYAELDVVGTPMMALGMEYPGVSTVANSLYDLNGATNGTPNRVYLDSVVAHEMGHQWFFNLVGSDQIEEPWLDESITQYLVRLFYEDYYGQAAAESYKDSWDGRWARVDYADIPIGKPSYEYESSEYSPIVYGRGPYFIEALEDKMGDDVFADALRDYVETYQWKIADSDEFKSSMESVCDCDLTTLFDEWVTP
jgi:hypothetical protein